jgi:hypothetical protein
VALLPEGSDLGLVAITGRAIAGARCPCGAGGVYTRVDSLARWIDATLEAWLVERANGYLCNRARRAHRTGEGRK